MAGNRDPRFTRPPGSPARHGQLVQGPVGLPPFRVPRFTRPPGSPARRGQPVPGPVGLPPFRDPRFTQPGRHGESVHNLNPVVHVLQFLCENDGTVEYDMLEQTLGHSQLKTLLDSYPNLFRIEKRKLEKNKTKLKLVSIATTLELCGEHSSKNGQCDGRLCGGLHVCKFFLLGSCQRHGKCSFGHDLFQGHNLRLLQQHNLETLTVDQLRIVFKNNRDQHMQIKICSFYNSKAGCRNAKSGKGCPGLHLCRFYVIGRCNGQGLCQEASLSHDLTQPAILGMLESYGIDTRKSPKELQVELYKAVNWPDKPVSKLVPAQAAQQKRDLPSYQGENDVEICIFNLRGKCSYKTDCTRIHASIPYLWQYKLGDNWVTFSYLSHRDLQLNYSDPSNEECHTTVNLDTKRRSNVAVAKVNFEKMVMTESSNQQQYKIRHFSTKSYALAAPTHIFVTKWCWYWLDEQGAWKEYGEQATSTASPKASIATKTSKEIEECFMEDPQGSMPFETQTWKYSISFSQMQQKNLSAGTTRKIRRRPVFLVEDGSRKPENKLKRGQSESSASPDKSTTKQSSTPKLGPETALSFPPHWDVTYVDPVSNDADYQLVPITNSGDTKAEFDKLEKQFMETMSGRKLKSIKRIQNYELWEKYCLRKTWMEKKLVAGQTVKEELLFHGTKACFTKAVYTQGLDWRLAGTSSGTLYGKGSYFSKSAKYSSKYTDNMALFMVQVLVGESTQGQGSYVKPPPKDPAKPYENFYDSCVDNPQNPTMYIIFKDEQIYPAYLLEY